MAPAAPPPLPPQDPWKKQTQQMLLKINKDIDAGFRAVITEIRNLGFQVKQFSDGVMVAVQQVSANMEGQNQNEVQELKERVDELMVSVQSMVEGQAGKFFELRNLISDVELNILSRNRDRTLVEERKREFEGR